MELVCVRKGRYNVTIQNILEHFYGPAHRKCGFNSDYALARSATLIAKSP